MSYTYAGRYADVLVSATTGRPLPGTAVTVYNADGVTLATLYTNRTKTAGVNPVLSDANANLGFYAAPGNYVLSYNGATLAVLVPPDYADDGGHDLAHGKASGGTQAYGIPGATLGADTTLAITAGRDYYLGAPLIVSHPITLDTLAVEITTGPAGASNLRLAIYAADNELQPSGAPLYDSGDVAVANGFTGIKTVAPALALPVGRYLAVINLAANMTLRTWQMASPVAFGVSSALGAASTLAGGYVARAYAAFPNPGTKWTTEVKAALLPAGAILAKWTEL